MIDPISASAAAIAAAVRSGATSAVAVTRAHLDHIEAREPALNCFTTVLAERALAVARTVDAVVAAGRDPGPLAGVPFAVKDLFDIAGVTTLAGSRIRRDAPPAAQDATIVARLSAAGAVLLGAQVMDEFAYGFTTENAHYGATRNPRDPAHVAGGSSGGSAASVAAGMVPLALGTDTNGSIRVPAAFCGVFGLKPTYGRLSRSGVFPFVDSLDHAGAFARSVPDLALAYDVMQGPDPSDPVQVARPVEPASEALASGIDGLHIATLGGWFREGAEAATLEAVDRVAAALGARDSVELPEAARARAAAFCITAAEGAALHLPTLRSRPDEYDPATRDRLLAGALLPGSVVVQAQRLRRWFREQAARLFAQYDVLLAPATPGTAPLIGQATMMLGDREVPVRPNLGLYTQPLSFIGLPIVCVPVARPGALPLGVQIVAAPWAEATALRVAAWLERRGVVAAPVAG